MRRILLALFVLCISSSNTEAQQGSALVGSWRLVSFESRDDSGQVQYPMGRDVTGMLIYDAGGRVSSHIMRSDRPRFASGDRAAGTESEVRAAFVGYLAYFGRFDVDRARGTVTHHIDGATFPNWVGGDQVRHFALARDQLTMTTPRFGPEDGT